MKYSCFVEVFRQLKMTNIPSIYVLFLFHCIMPSTVDSGIANDGPSSLLNTQVVETQQIDILGNLSMFIMGMIMMG